MYSHWFSPSGFAPEALHAAVHFVDTSASFPIALARSIDFVGPANYCPVLVGSIGGARRGRKQIEISSLSQHGTIVPQLETVAVALTKGWQNNDIQRHDA